MFGQRSGEGLLVDRLMRGVLDPVLGDVLLGEVTEGAVRIFRRIGILPRLVGLIVLFAKDAPELVLACV